MATDDDRAQEPVRAGDDGDAEGTERHDWEHDDRGNAFGADAFDDEQRELLLEEGVDPDEFFPSAPHPF